MSDRHQEQEVTPAVIDCREVTRTYTEGPEKLTIFSDISLQVRPGETVAIVGSSGAGKTTLLNLLGGLDRPSSGHIRICGQDIHRLSEAGRAKFRSGHLGFVYQFHHLLPEFSALENVMMPCALAGMKPAQAKEKAKSLLVRVGLAERLEHKPAELSGGERQRVAIARALVNDPQCVLMDEPTGNLDEQTGEGVRALIEDLRDQSGTAFVMVTHDMSMARSLGRVLRLEQGRLVQEV